MKAYKSNKKVAFHCGGGNGRRGAFAAVALLSKREQGKGIVSTEIL